MNSHNKWQTVQIQISWLLQKPTDLDLHCLQRRGISRFSMTRVNTIETDVKHQLIIINNEIVDGIGSGLHCHSTLSICDAICTPTGIR